ncbi:MAG TPA: beta/gamma crystallin-related protein [Allosphingosinicella sp.]|nr:beta/gamma crystallin-related protein [Allosphingosinicella sp.]
MPEANIPDLVAITHDLRTANRIPEIVLFGDRNFRGFQFRSNLSYPRISFSDTISSFIVIDGLWEFFKHEEYQGKLGTGTKQFGVGYYPWVEDVGIPNDTISGFRCVGFAP